MEAVLGAIVVALEPDELVLGLVLVDGGRRLAAAHDDRLEVLAAHDGPEPAAPVEVLELVHDGGEAHQLLAGDTALHDANALVAQLGLEPVLHVAGELAPVPGGVAELDLVVLDPHVGRRLGLAVQDHAVPAGRAQLGSPPAAGLGLAVAAGQRRFRRRRVAVGAGERQAVDDAGHEDEDVVGAEGIDARLQFAQQEPGGHGAAAEMPPQDVLGNFFHARLAGGEVHVQELGGQRAGGHEAILLEGPHPIRLQGA